jgi:hypothetical protein
MIENNYDGATARTTWQAIQALAQQQHQYLLAARASGEQGIAAFLLGDIATAKVRSIVRASNDEPRMLSSARSYSMNSSDEFQSLRSVRR